MMQAPQGFEKFEAKRGGRGESFPLPYIRISKYGIYINRATMKKIGEKYTRVILHFNKKTNTIGVWFWKEVVLGSYKIVKGKYPNAWHITAGAFLEEFDILKKIEKSGKQHFPFKQDPKNKEFYTATIK